MFRISITLYLLCLSGPALVAEDAAPKPMPKEEQLQDLPLQTPARIDGEGRLQYWSTSLKRTTENHTTPLETVRFLTASGKDVSVEEAKERLATWNPVVLWQIHPIGMLASASRGNLDPKALAQNLERGMRAWRSKWDVEKWQASEQHPKQTSFLDPRTGEPLPQYYLKPDTLVIVVMTTLNPESTPLNRKIPPAPHGLVAKWVTGDGAAAMELSYAVLMPVYQTEDVTDAAGNSRSVTICKHVRVERSARLAADRFQLLDAQGRVIAADRYPGLLADSRPVVVSADGKKVHPVYLRNLKEDVLVVVPVPAEGDAKPGRNWFLD